VVSRDSLRSITSFLTPKETNTVGQDVVSYLVKKLHPVLQLEQVGPPTGNVHLFIWTHNSLTPFQAGNAGRFSSIVLF
jgi:hypothetical protein